MHTWAMQQAAQPPAHSSLAPAATRPPSCQSLGGLQGVDRIKKEIREILQLVAAPSELHRAVGAKPPTGLLLEGPPGTGKTLLA